MKQNGGMIIIIIIFIVLVMVMLGFVDPIISGGDDPRVSWH
jgi:hypothetical protein